jgi:hypothetical protein
MKFLPAAVLLALLATIVPTYAFVTPSFVSSSPTTTAVPLKSVSALPMVATTGDLGLTVHGEAKPRKTREVCSVLMLLSCSTAALMQDFIYGISTGILGVDLPKFSTDRTLI